jgi:putative acyl-CoA dehydrogenase
LIAITGRLAKISFHFAYQDLMAIGIEAGVASAAWQDGSTRGLHVGLMFLNCRADPGPSCPMPMIYAAIPARRAEPEVYTFWAPCALADRYDPFYALVAKKTDLRLVWQ